MIGYVSGWGLTDFGCDTNSKGPEKFNWCKFPFEYQGNYHHSCIKDDLTPSQYNPICQELELQTDKSINEETDIVYLRNKTMQRTTCFPTSPGPFGWCGTRVSTPGNPEPENPGFWPIFQPRNPGDFEDKTRVSRLLSKTPENGQFRPKYAT